MDGSHETAKAKAVGIMPAVHPRLSGIRCFGSRRSWLTHLGIATHGPGFWIMRSGVKPGAHSMLWPTV